MADVDASLPRGLSAPLVLGTALVAAAWATLAGVSALALPFGVALLTLPGYALVRLVRLRDPGMEALLGVALSLSMLGLVALAQITFAAWDPRSAGAALLLLGAGAAFVEVAVRDWHGSGRNAGHRAAAPEDDAGPRVEAAATPEAAVAATLGNVHEGASPDGSA